MPEPTAPTAEPTPPVQPQTTTSATNAGPSDARVDLTERGESVRRTDMRGAFDPNNATDAALSTTLFALFVVSIIVFGTAADQCNDADNCDANRVAWAISVGAISAFITLIWLFLRHLAKLAFPPIVDFLLALFFVIFWSFGVGFTTGVGGPFSGTNNGYFASWAALILSVLYLAHSWARMGNNFYVSHFHHSLLVLLLGSLVVMGTAANLCNTDGVTCDNRLAWAVSVGAISAFFCLLQMLLSYCAYNVAQATGRIIGFLLLLLWIFGAAFNTSVPDGPFNTACTANPNGYFATWLAFGAALVYFWRVIIENVPEERA